MTHCDGSLDAIDDIPVPLTDPEFESPLAWEIMWSDPVSNNYQFSEEEENEIKNNSGFVFNSRRGPFAWLFQALVSLWPDLNPLIILLCAHIPKCIP